MMKKIAGILSLLLCTVLLPGLQVKAAPSENTRYVTLSSSEHSVEVDKDNAMVQYMNLNYGQVVQEGEKFYLRLEFAAKRYNIKNDKPGAPTDLLSGLEYKNGEYFVDVTDSFQDENREVFYSSSKLSGDRYLKIYSARIPLDITSFEEAGNTSVRIKATVSAKDYETTLHLEEVTEEKPEITPVFWPYNYYKTSDGLFGPQPGASNKNRLLNYYIQYPCTEYGGITWYYSTAGDEEITEDTDSSSTNSFMVTADSNRQEAYTETVRVRGRVKTADGNGQWLEETSLEVPFSKAGISGVSDEETGIEVVGYNNTIPYDTVLTAAKISDSERMQEAASLLKEEAGDQFGDFRLYDINLSDPDGNAIVLLNPTGEWGEGIYSIDSFGSTVKKNIVFNLDEEDEEEGYYPSNCKIYYLNNGKIEELYTYPTSNAMGNIIGTYEENRDPSGTYILMRTPLTNLEEDMEAGNYKVLSGIFLLPVTMQSHQIKISRNRKQIQQCAVENGTLFSCISFRTRYDESVTKKKERTPSRQRHCSLLRSLLRSNRSRSSMLMIRRFSIFCKLNEIKFSDRKWFEDAAGMPLPPDQPCPYCLSKGTLRLFGHYNRYLVEWDGNTQKCSTVTVQRHICDSCGHTHAILPSCIVPYRSYSLRFLLLVLRAYFTRPGSVEGLCDHYGITISMLYRWLRLFQQQKALWLGMLEDLFVPAVPFIDAMDVTLLKEFFLAFRFSYLESPRVTDPEMPPRKQQHPGSIT